MSDASPKPTVVIVGGGFAGVGCAEGARGPRRTVTLIDRMNYHHSSSRCCYQVATAELGVADVARPIRAIVRKPRPFDASQLDGDGRRRGDPHGDDRRRPARRSAATTSSSPPARGPTSSTPPGAERARVPLYTVNRPKAWQQAFRAPRSRQRTNRERIDEGGSTSSSSGRGPTGVETAGRARRSPESSDGPHAYHSFDITGAGLHGRSRPVVLAAFSDKAHEYAAGKLQHRGVELLLGIGVPRSRGPVRHLSDGTEILTGASCRGPAAFRPPGSRAHGAAAGRGGASAREADLLPTATHNGYVIGDIASDPRPRGKHPPAARVRRAAEPAIGRPRTSSPTCRRRGRTPVPLPGQGDHGDDRRRRSRGRDGQHHHELHGHVAFCAWLGVHAYLMSGSRTTVDVHRVGQRLHRLEPGQLDHRGP